MAFQLWNRTDYLYPPGGGKMTPEQAFAQWPWAENPAAKVIITTGAINCGVFMEFEATRDLYAQQGMAIPDDATDEEIVALIWDWEHRPAPEPDISDEVLIQSVGLIMQEGE
jgi:hypothetical protein